MADAKISGLTALTAPDALDEFVLVDKSDTTMAATGTDKKITVGTFDARWGGIYRLVAQGGTRLTATSASGTKYFAVTSTTDVASGVMNPGANSAHAGMYGFSIVAADHVLGSLTTKLRLRTVFQAQNTAPAVTITVGLYPVAIGTSILTLGTVISGSTVSFASPAANTLTTSDSTDFTIPTDGYYAVGYIVSGTPAAGASFQYQLQVRNV